jgi:hypothetical protein
MGHALTAHRDRSRSIRSSDTSGSSTTCGTITVTDGSDSGDGGSTDPGDGGGSDPGTGSPPPQDGDSLGTGAAIIGVGGAAAVALAYAAGRGN